MCVWGGDELLSCWVGEGDWDWWLEGVCGEGMSCWVGVGDGMGGWSVVVGTGVSYLLILLFCGRGW